VQASFANCYNSSTSNFTDLGINLTTAKSSSELFFKYYIIYLNDVVIFIIKILPILVKEL